MSGSIRPQGFSLIPNVVKNLLIINGLFFLGTIALQQYGIDLVRLLGLHYFESEFFKPHQIFTHMFMHGGMAHIFFNMFALWMFGASLENYWGGKRFLIYYLVTGLGAAAIHLGYTTYHVMSLKSSVAEFAASPGPEMLLSFMNEHVSSGYMNSFKEVYASYSARPESAMLADRALEYMREYTQIVTDIPTVGASGAVFGVLLAFGMTFPNSLIYVYFAIPIKAKYFVLMYGALELYSGMQRNPDNNVAHFAHLGGMVFGYFLIKYWQRNRFRIN